MDVQEVLLQAARPRYRPVLSRDCQTANVFLRVYSRFCTPFFCSLDQEAFILILLSSRI
jgi:hypothetical protein